jgi:hypothetical protein
MGKTVTVKVLMKALESCRKKRSICRATGITAVRSIGGTTLHSWVRLGIDEQFQGSF